MFAEDNTENTAQDIQGTEENSTAAAVADNTGNNAIISQINEVGQLLQETLIETAGYLSSSTKTSIRHTMLKSSFASIRVLLAKLEEEIG